MCRERLLERQEDGRYGLGLRLFEIGERVPIYRSLSEVARPVMEDLREATRQRIHLAVLEGVDVVYVEIVGANLLSVGSRTGGRFPAHATGVGKALLAYSPAAVVQARIDAGLPRLTPGRSRRRARSSATFARPGPAGSPRTGRSLTSASPAWRRPSSAVTPRCGLPCPSRAGRPRSTRPASDLPC